MTSPDNNGEVLKALENMDLNENIGRVDKLLEEHSPSSVEQMGIRLGIRLALGMALEIKEHKPLGSGTGVLIADWVQKYGQAQAEEAVRTARSFLLNPAGLKSELEKRILSI